MSEERAATRDPLERMVLRAPALAKLATTGVGRLPPGSALRRRLLERQIKRAFAAMARSDVELVLLTYEPDAEVWMRSMAGVGVSDCYVGHDGIRRLYAEIDEVFDRWWWSLRAIADGGDRLAVRCDFTGYGRISGAETTVRNGGTAARLSPRGLVVWQEWFAEQDGWEKALAAVGLEGA
jgi:hypothetical protein